MKVLIICEESQAVCKAFRERGHEAYSCDLKPCSGGRPEWHIKDDGLKIMKSAAWDLIIAHPPCTYLAKSGACNLISHGIINENRLKAVHRAREFFMTIYNADIPKICIENPVPHARAELPPYSQVIQPFDFGDNYSKMTLLWLKGLPPLIPNCIVTDRRRGGADVESWCKIHRAAEIRSKTFNGIAQAMAQQWGGNILNL